MEINKKTGRRLPKPTIGKTVKDTQLVRFVDLNQYVDEITKFVGDNYSEIPATKENKTVISLSQSGTSDPTIDKFLKDEIKSDTGEDITYTLQRNGPGLSSITLDNPVTNYEDIVVDIENVTDGDTSTSFYSSAIMTSNTEIFIITGFTSSGTAIDDLLNKTKLTLTEIK